jgi:hypothetical protein
VGQKAKAAEPSVPDNASEAWLHAESARRRQRQSPPRTPGIAARHRTVRGSPEQTKSKGDARRGPAAGKLWQAKLNPLRWTCQTSQGPTQKEPKGTGRQGRDPRAEEPQGPRAGRVGQNNSSLATNGSSGDC